jgi:hypothetical protein
MRNSEFVALTVWIHSGLPQNKFIHFMIPIRLTYTFKKNNVKTYMPTLESSTMAMFTAFTCTSWWGRICGRRRITTFSTKFASETTFASEATFATFAFSSLFTSLFTFAFSEASFSSQASQASLSSQASETS